MMLKKSNTVLHDVDSFTLTNDGVYCVKKNTVSLSDFLFNPVRSYTFAQDLQEISSYNTAAYANGMSSGSIIIREDAKEYPDLFIKKLVDENVILGTKDGKTVLYDVRNNQVLLEIMGKTFTFLLSQNHLYRRQKGTIENISLANGSLLWEIDITEIGRYIPFLEREEQEGEIRKFIGIWNGQLIVLLSGGKFIGINIATGKVLWENNKVETNPAKQERHYDFGDPYDPFLDEEKGMISILQGENYIEFDLKELKASYQWYNKETGKTQDILFIIVSRRYNNLICFTASKNENAGHYTVVGIFDILKKEVVWTYDFEFEKGVYLPNAQETLQMTDTALFILDSKGTLHQFEKI
jgi:hypothetical protein